ncbi:50S ribosomal protein L5 [Candidatus Roizmanbacteria bacterium RIFCSPHIGHO2_01_FULL_39_12c]|uniref:Large ribosomal subunit protein uL5 n=1 Tax=Candidatus Roizmanbacteria bacterium RIFCSPHIGHO2_01_FULL_39_12c TaxID=1802031 RepID=A0A1F7GFD1_9BACT|nr:MAG: 50S ribosomal protein L5 [Candidatus Roizmanbacteria bacterium RIFCSPHIGHO2_01_FULL_39_12c]OGK47581.1 MAG: 50S ribosomal protein L5 [Candidatus Roizmanbacteria bacterium RIFCSPLOWO2_01_FULL_40_13]
MSFKDYYNSAVKKKLKEELKLKNIMEVPKLKKIVVNVGAGEAVTNKSVLDKIQEQLKLITGQKPVVTKARKSISAFKIRKGFPIGVKVTLRNKMMFNFLEKLIKVVIPRLRDFRGIQASSIDNQGNLNLGFSEQTIFPEIEFDKIDKIRGLEVTIVSSAGNSEKGKKLFEVLGIPFSK